MKKLTIAFDVDDTLIVPAVALDDEPHPYIGMYGAIPNYETVALYKWFQSQGNHMIVWSGGGVEYAKTWAEKLGLRPDEVRVKAKGDDVDIAFDDCDVDLAKVNVKVSRTNNSISRADWNKNKHA
jgi:hypothetical protein